MPDLLPHNELAELAYPYALEALEDDERRAVDRALQHAESDVVAAFRATVHDIRETLATMTVVDELPPPLDLENSILRAVDERIPAGGPATARRSWRWLAAAVVLIAMTVFGAGIIVQNNRSHDTNGVTAQQVITHSDVISRSAAVTGGGTVQVSVSRELGAATVSFDAVTPPSAGHAYQLWLIPDGGLPHSAAVLDSLPTARQPLVVKVGESHQIAVSIEPSGGSALPTTTPVAALPLA